MAGFMEILPGTRLRATKLHKSQHVDYVITLGRTVRWIAEMKCRTFSISDPTYKDGYLISLEKVMNGWRTSQVADIPLFLVVQLTDWRGYCDMRYKETEFTIIIGGRGDRNDPADTELCALIPWHQFESF